MNRRLAALLSSTLVAAAITPTAHAGQFVVTSCGESPTNEATGWTLTTSATTDSGLQCPPVTNQPVSDPTRSSHTGIYLTDKLGAANTPPGTTVAATFRATAGTTITRARVWRNFDQQGEPNWRTLGSTLEGVPLDSCPVNDGGCAFGGGSYAPGAAENGSAFADFAGLSTSGLEYRLTCQAPAGSMCTNGSTVYRTSLSIFGTKLTVDDSSAPVLQTPTGAAWTVTGFQQGTLTLSAASSDNTGIATTQLLVDGAQMGESPRSCNYSRPAPCTDEPGATIALNTAALSDGPHTIAVRALDAATNPATVTRATQLQTDNTAPAAPQNLRPDGPATRSSNQWSVQWDLAPDTGSPITRAYYAICPAGSTSGCTSAQADGQGIQQTPSFALPGPGSWDVRVRLGDQLGHTDPARDALTTLTYTPPAPPNTTTTTSTTPSTPPPTTSSTTTTPPPPTTTAGGGTPPPPPTVKRSAGLRLTRATRGASSIAIAGTTTAAASGSVKATFSQRIAGRTLHATRTVHLTRGRFSLRLRLTGALARTRKGTLTIAYDGSSRVRPASIRKTLTRR